MSFYGIIKHYASLDSEPDLKKKVCNQWINKFRSHQTWYNAWLSTTFNHLTDHVQQTVSDIAQ